MNNECLCGHDSTADGLLERVKFILHSLVDSNSQRSSSVLLFAERLHLASRMLLTKSNIANVECVCPRLLERFIHVLYLAQTLIKCSPSACQSTHFLANLDANRTSQISPLPLTFTQQNRQNTVASGYSTYNSCCWTC